MVSKSVCGNMIALPDVSAPMIPMGTDAVQVIMAPGVDELIVTCCVVWPEQIVWGPGVNTTVGLGLIVTT